MLELFDELQREFGFAALFISHDLAVVDLLADRIAVLYRASWSRRAPAPRCSARRSTRTRSGCWPRCRCPTPTSRPAAAASGTTSAPPSGVGAWLSATIATPPVGAPGTPGPPVRAYSPDVSQRSSTLNGGLAVRRLTVVLGLLAVLLVGAASPALAVAPLQLASRITDQVGALKGHEQEVSRRHRQPAGEGRDQRVRRLRGQLRRHERRAVGGSRRRSSPGWAARTSLLAVAIDDARTSACTPVRRVRRRRRPRGHRPGQAEAASWRWGGDWGERRGGRARRRACGTGERRRLVVGGGSRCWSSVGIVVVAGGGYMFTRSAASPAGGRGGRRPAAGPPDPYAGTPTEQLQLPRQRRPARPRRAVADGAVNVDYARSYFGEEAVPGFDEGLARRATSWRRRSPSARSSTTRSPRTSRPRGGCSPSCCR